MWKNGYWTALSDHMTGFYKSLLMLIFIHNSSVIVYQTLTVSHPYYVQLKIVSKPTGALHSNQDGVLLLRAEAHG